MLSIEIIVETYIVKTKVLIVIKIRIKKVPECVL